MHEVNYIQAIYSVRIHILTNNHMLMQYIILCVCSVTIYSTDLIITSSTKLCMLYRHKQYYFLDYYNYLDAPAVIFTFLIIPFRAAGLSAQWFFASLSYIFNGLRAFKYAAVFRYCIHTHNLCLLMLCISLFAFI